MAEHRLSEPGGTPGGLGEFVIGFIMACVGGYMISNQVTVTGGYWNFSGGGSSFGLTLVPLLIGIAMLFWNGKSVLGWLLTVGGSLFILAGILMNLHIYFQPATLFNTVLMLILLVGGVVLIAKSVRPHASKAAE